VVAAALAFTAHHVIALAAQFNWGVTLLGSLGVFSGGAAWSWLYLRYRSIWPGYISHAMVDVAIFVIGYGLIFGGGTR
jgi:membrane protease YdiL (CAAX protease family)